MHYTVKEQHPSLARCGLDIFKLDPGQLAWTRWLGQTLTACYPITRA
jgi:hypothetical protein